MKNVLKLLVLLAIAGSILYPFYKKAANEKYSNITFKNNYYKTNYLVITSKEGKFASLAKYLASKKKDAPVLYYDKKIAELLPEIRERKPRFVALVADPEELDYETLSSLNKIFSQIDTDEFLDTSFGIITARNLESGFSYIDRLVAGNNKTPKNILSSNMPVKPIDVVKSYYGGTEVYCTETVQSGFNYCPKEDQLLADKISQVFKQSDAIFFNFHGTPNSTLLDDSAIMGGDKLTLVKNDGTVQTLKSNASLVFANSCLTTRVKGVSNKVSPTYPPENDLYVGQVESSIVLSFLDAGVLNYIGAHNFSNLVISPDQEVIYGALIEGVSFGEIVKLYTNKYRFLASVIAQERESAPKANKFTVDFVEDMANTWLLFGDPEFSFKPISKKNEPVYSCAKMLKPNSFELDIHNKDEAGNEREYSNISIFNDISEEGQFFSYGCFISVKSDRQINEYELSISGIKPEYLSSYKKNGELSTNLGDEVFVIVPDFHFSTWDEPVNISVNF